MSIADLVHKLVAAGASPEVIAISVEAVESAGAAVSEQRAKASERKRRQRGHGTVTGQSRDKDVTVTDKNTPPCPPPSFPPDPLNTPPLIPPKKLSVDDDFEDWWQDYPKKVGKGQALKAYRQARKKVSAETLVEGLARYVASDPDPQFTANPATWLNGDRWLDEPVKAKAAPSPGIPPPRREVTDAEWETRVRKWSQNGFWLSNFGPRPDALSTQVPKRILEKFKVTA